MSRPLGSKDKVKRRRRFLTPYTLACSNCLSLHVYYRRGEWFCRECKLTFPAEKILRIGVLPPAFDKSMDLLEAK